jgi:hypothetical protein
VTELPGTSVYGPKGESPFSQGEKRQCGMEGELVLLGMPAGLLEIWPRKDLLPLGVGCFTINMADGGGALRYF